MDIAYGIKILPQNDPYVDAAEKAMASANAAATPGKYLVDFVPIRTFYLYLLYRCLTIAVASKSNTYHPGYLGQASRR